MKRSITGQVYRPQQRVYLQSLSCKVPENRVSVLGDKQKILALRFVLVDNAALNLHGGLAQTSRPLVSVHGIHKLSGFFEMGSKILR